MLNLMSGFWKKIIKAIVEIVLDLIQKKGQN